MTLLSAILCRAFGHKPYTHPHIVWEKRKDWSLHLTPPNGTPVIVTRCSRCNVKLAERPMLAGEDEIQA